MDLIQPLITAGTIKATDLKSGVDKEYLKVKRLTEQRAKQEQKLLEKQKLAAEREERLAAEAEVMMAKTPTVAEVSLGEPLGMTINQDGTISKVATGKQGERLGLVPGHRIVGAGGNPVATLDGVKEAIAGAKATGEASVFLEFIDPKQAAVAR